MTTTATIARASTGRRPPAVRRRNAIGLVGFVTSAGFASGDRFVVGHWVDGPLGPMNDIMWARPDGSRVLIADSERTAKFVCAIYSYDEVVVRRIECTRTRRTMTVFVVDELELSFELRRVPLPIFVPRRPLWFTRWLERPVCRLVFPRVRTYGVHANGVHQWYQASWVRLVRHSQARHRGVDLGRWRGIRERVGFGFSEPPHLAAQVRVQPQLYDPTSTLNEVLRRLQETE